MPRILGHPRPDYDFDMDEIEDAEIVPTYLLEQERLKAEKEKAKAESGTGIELYQPDKYDLYKEFGYNEMTRVIGVKDEEPQIVKIKEAHACKPPRLGEFGNGTVWKCGCGAKWKVKAHFMCDNNSHPHKQKWRKLAFGFIPWGMSRFA